MSNTGNSVADVIEQKVTCPHCSGSRIMGLDSLLMYLRLKGIEDEATVLDSLTLISSDGDCPCIGCGGEGTITREI